MGDDELCAQNNQTELVKEDNDVQIQKSTTGQIFDNDNNENASLTPTASDGSLDIEITALTLDEDDIYQKEIEQFQYRLSEPETLWSPEKSDQKENESDFEDEYQNQQEMIKNEKAEDMKRPMLNQTLLR